MSVHKRSFKNRISYIILAVVIILALLTTVFFAQLSRHISEISEFESKQAALDVINAAINRELEKLPQSSYIKISETDGRITSINSDTNAVNRLQSSVSRAVNESLSQLEGTKLSVPIGTILQDMVRLPLARIFCDGSIYAANELISPDMLVPTARSMAAS